MNKQYQEQEVCFDDSRIFSNTFTIHFLASVITEYDRSESMDMAAVVAAMPSLDVFSK